MSEAEIRALKEAVRSFKGDESFEQVFGKCLRREDLPYDSYVKVIGLVRKRAKKDGVPLERAARKLVRDSSEV
jgi:hypothetical protein